MRQLEARGIRLIILDELQRVTELRLTEQRHILNALKYLSNRLSISIAGFGSGEARVLIESDLHLAERFDIVALPLWTKAERWAVDAVKARVAWMPLRKPTAVDHDFMAAPLSFHQLKDRVCSAIDGNPEQWWHDEALAGEDGPPRDEQEMRDELKAEVRRAQSVAEIIKALWPGSLPFGRGAG